jgi:hypothetical protein
MTIWLQSSDKIVTSTQFSGTPGVFPCNNTVRTLVAFDLTRSGLRRSAGETKVSFYAGPFQSGLRYLFRLGRKTQEKSENS